MFPKSGMSFNSKDLLNISLGVFDNPKIETITELLMVAIDGKDERIQSFSQIDIKIPKNHFS